MPGLGPILDAMGDKEATEGLSELLLLSGLSFLDWHTWCLSEVSALKFCFCYAQANDTVAKLCHLLRLFQNLHSQNSKHLSLAQRALTHTRGLFNSLWARMCRSRDCYSHACKAMLALDPDEKLAPGWTKRFWKLNEGDIHSPGCEVENTSEGQFTPSWIWLVSQLSQPTPTKTTASNDHTARSASINESSTAVDPEQTDSMHAHWVKCQAHAERYKKEAKLVVEEMGRTLHYFDWKRAWWLSLESRREESSTPPLTSVQHRLQAYAHHQANIYVTLIAVFAKQWRTLASHVLQPAWLSDYPAPATNDCPCSNPEVGLKSTGTRCKSPPFPQSNDDGTGSPLASKMEVNKSQDSNSDDDNNGNNNGGEDPDELDIFKIDFEDELMAWTSYWLLVKYYLSTLHVFCTWPSCGGKINNFLLSPGWTRRMSKRGKVLTWENFVEVLLRGHLWTCKFFLCMQWLPHI